jgi:hypothetical protein
MPAGCVLTASAKGPIVPRPLSGSFLLCTLDGRCFGRKARLPMSIARAILDLPLRGVSAFKL